MKNNNFNQSDLIKAIKEASGGSIDAEKLSAAAKRGDGNAILNSLSEDDKKKISGALADKKSLDALLKSSTAQAILKAFMNGSNGSGGSDG